MEEEYTTPRIVQAGKNIAEMLTAVGVIIGTVLAVLAVWFVTKSEFNAYADTQASKDAVIRDAMITNCFVSARGEPAYMEQCARLTGRQ